ncbi:hypothetical protein ACI65C_013362 [Semiaphis heraclei]
MLDKAVVGRDMFTLKLFGSRRADTGPSNNSRVCSCHFIDGNNAKGPSIFSWNKEKLFKFKSPEKRKRRRTHDVVLDNLDININVPEQTQIDLDDMNEEITSNINTNVSSTRSNLNLDISNVSKVQNDSEYYLLKMEIEKARVHVERAINRIKGFCILEFIPPKLLPYASKIFQVCGALSNFQYPLIKEVEIFYLQPKED